MGEFLGTRLLLEVLDVLDVRVGIRVRWIVAVREWVDDELWVSLGVGSWLGFSVPLDVSEVRVSVWQAVGVSEWVHVVVWVIIDLRVGLGLSVPLEDPVVPVVVQTSVGGGVGRGWIVVELRVWVRLGLPFVEIAGMGIDRGVSVRGVVHGVVQAGVVELRLWIGLRLSTHQGNQQSNLKDRNYKKYKNSTVKSNF